jgi:hypothetical protein
MSTYQNGNIFGITAAVFLLLAAQRIIKRSAWRHDWVLLGGAAISVGLSGSRTAIIATVVGLIALYLQSGSTTRKTVVLVFGAGIGFLSLQLVPGLADRYTLSSVVESGGSGRLQIWEAGFARTATWEWVVGAQRHLPLEGAPGILFQIGAIGIFLMGLLVVSLARRRHGWLVPLAGLGAAISVDYAYALFPTLFIPAAAMACSAVPKRHKRVESDAEAAETVEDSAEPSPRSAGWR